MRKTQLLKTQKTRSYFYLLSSQNTSFVKITDY